MKNIYYTITLLAVMILFNSCKDSEIKERVTDCKDKGFVVMTEQFGEFKVLRYKIPDFENMDLDKKKLAYYLYKAAHVGRDIYYDQNYKYNLIVRKTLEEIIKNYKGDKSGDQYNMFIEYAKSVFACNGIHHLFSAEKLIPEFSEKYFKEMIVNSPEASFPKPDFINSLNDFIDFISPVIFSEDIAAKKIELNPNKDIIKHSATNYYHEALKYDDVNDFYAKLRNPDDPRPVSHGLNSKLMLDEESGEIYERVWKIGGMYNDAIQEIVYWLKKALPYTENNNQKLALEKLIEYYKTGCLRTFDEYSILWVKDTDSDIDVTNGFIEVYDDPVGRKGAYQSMLSVIDNESSRRTRIISDNAQWFEDNLPIDEKFKRNEAVGMQARAINVITVAGDNAPTPPIGVNLPNSNWIRAQYGSKSVTITNIFDAHREAAQATGVLEEFAYTEREVELSKKYNSIAGNLLIDMHEIIGHGSGKLGEGVADPATTLRSYYSPLEEARADLVALYFIMDENLVELELMPSIDVGKAQYDSYIRNGMLNQLIRIQPGGRIDQAHMRGRKLISKWAIERGKDDNVIEKIRENNKTYFVINDYYKLRDIFGELLKEVQRIKSEGDYEAGKKLIEEYAVNIDPDIHAEVIERYEKLNFAPYTVFINPVLVPIYENDEIIDVEVEYPKDFLNQMIYYGDKYSFLPIIN